MSAVLNLDDVSVRYGGVTGVERVSCDIPAGVSVAVIGPNGSGKSTLLKAMAGILRPSSGVINTRKNKVSIVLQATDVEKNIPLTVRSTVTMARFAELGIFGRLRPSDREAVSVAIKSLGLEDLADRQIHNLSGGQRQRAFVAQGLAQRADVVLLDEPLTGLDVVSRQLIVEALEKERAAGRTTVMTTHSFADAERCDLVILLSTTCVACGCPKDVLTESNLQTAFKGCFVRVGETLVLDDPHHDHTH